MKDFMAQFAMGLFKAGLLWSVLVGLAVFLACGTEWDAIGLSLLVAVAASALGCLLGLVLGIPKANDAETQSALEQVATLNSAEAPLVRLAFNSNLLRISDWLTTLLVGLSLVHFRQGLDGLGWLGDKYASVFSTKVFEEATARSAYGLALTLSSFVIGSILMYIWTSTRLLAVLREALAPKR